MGLFDFLKKKSNSTEIKPGALAEDKRPVPGQETPTEPITTNKAKKDIQSITEIPEMPTENKAPEASAGTTKEPYYGDLEKTGLLVELCAVPLEKRDEKWFREFHANIPLASFKAAEPQVIEGPDGFPYFQLELPEPGVAFQCYVIDHMVPDFLFANGLGVVINASKGEPDWVLTYGDVVNYAIKKDFFNTDNTHFNQGGDKQINPTDLENDVMVGQPAEFVLPAPTRSVLRSFLQKYKNVHDPKVLLMTTRTPDGREAQDLVFNFTPQDFVSEQEFQSTAQQMQWFLPRHYSLAFFSENDSLKEHFQAL
ncbi:MAG: hypothetical protein QM610_01560 [Chitinophagaceae bacterium]